MSANLSDDGIADAVATGVTLHGRAKWMLVISLGAVFFVLYTLYAAVLGVLLPNQVQDIDPTHKASMLGVVFAVTSIFSTTVTPLSGAFSDRTRTRGGLRRTPWILAGGTAGGVATILIPHGGDIVGVTALWVIATICLNSMQPAITTVVADRFRPSERGMVSGVVGACMTAGISAGTIFGGLMAARLSLAYAIVGAAILVVCVAFVLFNPEPPIGREVPSAPPLTPAAFLRGFWISPREHPDFAWAFLGRFAIYMGYQAILTYLLYILQDHIGLSQAQANATIARMSSVTLVMLVISGLLSGWLSDRIGRLKPLVFVAGLLMAAAVMAPLISPNLSGMFGYAVLIGLGYGAFMSIDLALMTHVLPNRGDGDDTTGRDLGILTTAVNVPQIISPVMAAALLSATHNNYPLLFVAAAGFVIAGSIFVLPIRSVR